MSGSSADALISELLARNEPKPMGVKRSIYVPTWLLDRLATHGIDINSRTTQAAFLALADRLEGTNGDNGPPC